MQDKEIINTELMTYDFDDRLYITDLKKDHFCDECWDCSSDCSACACDCVS